MGRRGNREVTLYSALRGRVNSVARSRAGHLDQPGRRPGERITSLEQEILADRIKRLGRRLERI